MSAGELQQCKNSFDTGILPIVRGIARGLTMNWRNIWNINEKRKAKLLVD